MFTRLRDFMGKAKRTIAFRVSDEEYHILTQEAERNGHTMSECMCFVLGWYFKYKSIYNEDDDAAKAVIYNSALALKARGYKVNISINKSADQ